MPMKKIKVIKKTGGSPKKGTAAAPKKPKGGKQVVGQGKKSIYNAKF